MPRLAKQLCQRDRRVEVDHRAERSRSNSASSSSVGASLSAGGTRPGARNAGRSTPSRTIWARCASVIVVPRPAPGVGKLLQR